MRAFFSLLLLLAFCPGLFAQVVNIEEQRITGTNDSTHWYGHLRGGLSLVKVKEQSLQIQSQAKVQYKKDPHLVLLLLNLNLLQAGKQDFARQAFAHLRYDYKINKIWSWEAFTQIQTSPLQFLDQRNLVGSGLRLRVLKSKDGRQRIYVGSAWLWEQNRFTEDYGRSELHRSSNYLSTTFRPGKQWMIIQTTYWQPVLGYIRNYRLSSEWVLKIDLTKKLSFVLDFEYNVDKNLPPGAPFETYAWRNGISLQL